MDEQRRPSPKASIVRPMPGGRAVYERATTSTEDDDVDREPVTFSGGDDNPLLAAASPLLAVAPSVRQSASHPDPQRLKDDLTRGIRTFEQRAAESGASQQNIVAARYVLCSFLDECAASTPWGGAGVWARDTLLVRMHNETWGGEKVFQLLTRLAQDPVANHDLLELIYVCLALGFEGRYRVLENGRSHLETLRERLYDLLQRQRGTPDSTLSAKWLPAEVSVRRWYDLTPLWVFMALSLAIGVFTFTNYRSLLNARSDPVFSLIQGITLPRPVPTPPAPSTAPTSPVIPALPVASIIPRLPRFLEAEVKAGLAAVHESEGKSVITIRGDGIFDPGSARVRDSVLPLLGRIAAELRQRPGAVIVTGHTDSQPIRSVRFPSNFHLSEERARVVASILARDIGAQRVKAEGKADAEPVDRNDTPSGRARNRRVEIALLAPQ